MITQAVAAMGPGELREDALVRHIHPLFSRVMARKEIYLANHSLGRPLDRTREDVAAAVELWMTRMDEAWDDWLREADRFRASIARLIGCPRSDAIVPKVSAGQGLRAVLNSLDSREPLVVATKGEFDSIDFILKAYEARGRARVRWVDPEVDGSFAADRIASAIGPGTDLVVVSAVYFATAQVLRGVEEVVHAAHARGAVVVLDAYHAAGAMPLDCGSLGVDFAIGGNYKYTRGGPGAGWLMVAPRHLSDDSRLRPIDTGWFAKRGTFAFRRADRPEYAEGGNAWLEATPSFLPPYQAKAGLELTLALGPDRLERYADGQLAFLEAALRRAHVPVRQIGERGAFLLLPAEDAPAACARLKAVGINADARPDSLGRGHLRLCPDILNTCEELSRAAEVIGRAMAR